MISTEIKLVTNVYIKLSLIFIEKSEFDASKLETEISSAVVIARNKNIIEPTC